MATQVIVLLLLLGMPVASGRGNSQRGTLWRRHFSEEMRVDPWSRYMGQPEVNPGNAHFRRFKRPLAVALAATTKKYLGKRDNELAAPHLSVRRRGSFHPTTAFLLIRGGAKVAPPTPSRGKGGNSRPILGPITRQGYDDAENDKALQKEEFSPQFLDFQSRVGFMKKVYLTVSCQLVYTGIVCRLMRAYRDPILRLLFANGNVPQVLFMVGTIGTIIATHATLWANVDLRQNFPKNVPLLTLFTTAWAAYVGVFSLMFTQGSVTMAVFQTAFVVGSLTAYAFRTNPKHELTQFGAGLYSAGNALAMFCIMKLLFFRHHKASDLALSCLATLFFSLFLVYDTYRIIGGKHRRSSMFGVKDWAVAAMALYEDIMQIFIHLLALFGKTEQ